MLSVHNVKLRHGKWTCPAQADLPQDVVTFVKGDLSIRLSTVDAENQASVSRWQHVISSARPASCQRPSTCATPPRMWRSWLINRDNVSRQGQPFLLLRADSPTPPVPDFYFSQFLHHVVNEAKRKRELPPVSRLSSPRIGAPTLNSFHADVAEDNS
jgi:hypothetical protein